MAASFKSIRATVKIAAIYAFALSTAVACSKFEVLKPGGVKTSATANNGTATGNANVTREGNTNGAPSELTVTIDKVTAVPLVDELGLVSFVKMDVEVSHGARKLSFSAYPQMVPYVQDKAKTTVGTVEYSAEGVCANDTCTKFGVLVNIVDSSNGVDFQRLEIWDTKVSTTTPQIRLAQTDFKNVTEAYETMTATQIGQ